jgi:hypothetical protein
VDAVDEWYLPELGEESGDDMVANLDGAATLVSAGTPVRLGSSHIGSFR